MEQLPSQEAVSSCIQIESICQEQPSFHECFLWANLGPSTLKLSINLFITILCVHSPLQGEKDFSLASHCLGMSPWSPPAGWHPACPSMKDEGWLPLCSHRGCFWPSALLSLSVSEPSATGPAWEAGELLFPCCETWDGSSSARAAPCLFLLPFCSLTPKSLCSVGSATC